ncbi:hypothetical protein CSB45_15075 [candidate division KSB3 bacterium]|uniref:Peptidoglycan peptidase n=1 Tax=candidate division KSB3 bacterium TaxID=2044937 RepID=A0A2G6E0P7_9BACT|nr:MAG: hypothetical protein CSB45_15075 [candidate division KSB3 bacterium]
MKKQLILTCVLVFYSIGCRSEYEAHNGDIIFQTSLSRQSIAIQQATNSKYSHVGIVYLKNNNAFVYEAVEPVKLTPLKKWIAQGKGKHFSVKRLANAENILTEKAVQRLLQVGKIFEGKQYDLYFEWSDETIYCSELVWKIYKRALNIEVGNLQKMDEFNFSDPLVQQKVHERFGDSLPEDEIVISPAAIFSSNNLVTIYEQ